MARTKHSRGFETDHNALRKAAEKFFPTETTATANRLTIYRQQHTIYGMKQAFYGKTDSVTITTIKIKESLLEFTSNVRISHHSKTPARSPHNTTPKKSLHCRFQTTATKPLHCSITINSLFLSVSSSGNSGGSGSSGTSAWAVTSVIEAVVLAVGVAVVVVVVVEAVVVMMMVTMVTAMLVVVVVVDVAAVVVVAAVVALAAWATAAAATSVTFLADGCDSGGGVAVVFWGVFGDGHGASECDKGEEPDDEEFSHG